ncbi:bacillithiol system redox-active protein YtxJ [Candidatus Latescibacterota bacterium]
MSPIKAVQSNEDIDQIFGDTLAIVFKHSFRCSVSSGAKHEFDRFAESYTQDGKLYIVDVVNNRDLSQEISGRAGVPHQSPQVLVIKDGTVVWNASHWNINQKSLEENCE